MSLLVPALQGRAAALEALRAALAAALQGTGTLALISGEAGIGKSALADVIAHEAEAQGARVLRGRAWEFADAPPYFPLWPVLRALGISVGPDAFELWEQVVSALAGADAQAPSVWIVEDLHAADLGTLDLLTFLAQPLRALKVLVVATLRSHDPRVSERMQQRLGRMARDGLELRLEPLSQSEVAALAQQVLGRGVAPSALQRLAQLTGGNPLFVLECARALDALGGAESMLRALPPTLRQLLLERVSLLPASCREALECGAVLGREFSSACVASILGTLPARAIDVLLPALRAALITEARPGQFVFHHVLVRDALEDALDPERRAALHARADAALEPLGTSSDVLVERARHALAALRSADAQHALELARLATELLEREGAFDRAFELQERLTAARGAGFLAPPTPEQRLELARLARKVGRSDVTRRECEQVLALALAQGNAELLARAALLHGADVRPGLRDPAQVAWLEQALAALGSAAPALRCRVLGRLATALQPTPQQERPMSLMRAALEQARATGDAEALLDVLEHAGWALFLAPLAERMALSRELLDLALARGDIPRALVAHVSLAFHGLEAGDVAAFDRAVEAALVLSDAIGHPRQRWRPLLLASLRANLRGRFAESDRHVTEVEQLSALIDDPALGLTLGIHQLLRRRLQRQDDVLRALCENLPEAMQEVDGFYRVLQRAQCTARLGDSEATRAALALLEPQKEQHMLEATDLAEAIALAGTDEARRATRAALLALGRSEMGANPLCFDYDGTIPRLLGLLAAGLGELAVAEAELRTALALERERGHAPWVAQLAYELARVLERAGRAAEAAQCYAESAQLARELGMPGLMPSARAEPGLASPALAGSAALELTRTADGWRIARGARALALKDSRGLQLLSKLVERPGAELHVLALASDEGAGVLESNAGELLDEAARAAYRARLAELDAELAAAERRADAARCTKLERERQGLLGELRRAFGLGGRTRRAGSATERARVNVQRRLKDAIARIAQLDSELGRFLEQSVCTGTHCCFRP